MIVPRHSLPISTHTHTLPVRKRMNFCPEYATKGPLSTSRRPIELPMGKRLLDPSILCHPSKEYKHDDSLSVADLDGTTVETSAAGSNETHLLTGHGATLDGRRVTNVLVVTTTVRVVDGVHSHTTSARPAVALDAVLVVGTTGLEHRLVNTTTTGNNTDGSTSIARHGLLGTRRKTDTRGHTVSIVANNSGVVTRGTGERTTVTDLLLDVAHNGTLRQRSERQNVTNVEHGLLTAVHKLTSVHTLSSNERLGAQLVAVRVTESNAGERSTTVMSASFTQSVHTGQRRG